MTPPDKFPLLQRETLSSDIADMAEKNRAILQTILSVRKVADIIMRVTAHGLTLGDL
jgi:hypothetical protein